MKKRMLSLFIALAMSVSGSPIAFAEQDIAVMPTALSDPVDGSETAQPDTVDEPIISESPTAYETDTEVTAVPDEVSETTTEAITVPDEVSETTTEATDVPDEVSETTTEATTVPNEMSETTAVPDDILDINIFSNDQDTVFAMSVTGADVVNYAYEKWKGTPWKQSGNPYGPGIGVDCSYLVQDAYKHYGFDVARSTTQQCNQGTGIDISQALYNANFSNLQPGDLIFFNDYGHVGMYYGNGNFVHTSSSRGVTIQSLKGYWNPRICCIRRIINGTAQSVHSHSWQYAYDSGHPHRQYRTCSCGAKEYTGTTQQVSSCASCFPIGNVSIKRSFNKTKKTATLIRNDVVNANAYTLKLYKDGSVYKSYNMSSIELYLTNLPSGTYYATLTASNTNTGRELSVTCKSFTIVDSYTITYNANGGTGAPAQQLKIQDTVLSLTNDTPTRTGYVFKGWSTNKTATTATYLSGGKYTKNTKATLYAVWEPETYTVKFDANGGTGALSDITVTYGNTISMPNSIIYDGYYLKGWSVSKSSSTPEYKIGMDYSISADTSLYAVWGSSAWGGDIASSFSGGDGTEDNPYQISNAGELAYLAKIVNSQTSEPEYKYYALTNNIDLNYESWVPIGVMDKEYQYFKGSFDGKGYTISSLSIKYMSDSSYAGLFGCAKDSEIKDFTIVGEMLGISSESDVYAGLAAGRADDTTISDISLQYANISNIYSTSSFAYIGGIVGYGETISNCSALNSYINLESGRYMVGIIAGKAQTITNCSVTSEDELFSSSSELGNVYMGGICGTNSSNIYKCSVKASYLAKNISSANIYAGGIAGDGGYKINLCSVEFLNGFTSEIDGESYSSSFTSNNSGSSYIGGIVGYRAAYSDGTIKNCKYNGQSISNKSTGYSEVGGIAGRFSGASPSYKTVRGGMPLSRTSLTTKEGYKATWYTNEKMTQEYDFTKDVTGNLRLYAKWEEYTPQIWDGTSEEPEYDPESKTYKISNAKELAWISEVSNGTVISGTNMPSDVTFAGYTIELTDDIYLNNTGSWYYSSSDTAPDNTWLSIKEFSGTFNGNCYAIIGMYTKCGLFNIVNEGASVKNLALTRGKISYITTEENVGSVAAKNYGTIENCINSNGVLPSTSDSTVNNSSIGGIVGYNKGFISSCLNNSNVTSKINSSSYTIYVGGIAGYNAGTISGCSNGDYTVYGRNAGGIAGYHAGLITECINHSSLTGLSVAGGIAAIISTSSKISYCISAVSDDHYGYLTDIIGYYAGGIAGYCTSGKNTAEKGSGAVIEYCYVKSYLAAVDSSSAYCAGGILAMTTISTVNINQCYSVAKQLSQGQTYTGGLVGKSTANAKSTVFKYCYTTNNTLYTGTSPQLTSSGYKK